MEKCGEYVTTGTCSGEVLEPIVNIVDEFIKASNCSKTITSSSSSLTDSSPLTGASTYIYNCYTSSTLVVALNFLSFTILAIRI